MSKFFSLFFFFCLPSFGNEIYQEFILKSGNKVVKPSAPAMGVNQYNTAIINRVELARKLCVEREVLEDSSCVKHEEERDKIYCQMCKELYQTKLRASLIDNKIAKENLSLVDSINRFECQYDPRLTLYYDGLSGEELKQAKSLCLSGAQLVLQTDQNYRSIASVLNDESLKYLEVDGPQIFDPDFGEEADL